MRTATELADIIDLHPYIIGKWRAEQEHLRCRELDPQENQDAIMESRKRLAKRQIWIVAAYGLEEKQ